MKSSSFRIIAISLLLAFSAQSGYPATAQCVGKVTEVGNHVPGGVYVRVGSAGITKICDLNVTYFRTSSADCKQHLATAMLAMVTGKTVSLWIDNALATTCTSTSIIEWSSSDMRYFSVIP